MKKYNTFLLAVVFGTSLWGCTNKENIQTVPLPPLTNSGVVSTDLATKNELKVPAMKVEMQTHLNKVYGYSIELPKTWGGIAAYDRKFVPLSDEADKYIDILGPNPDLSSDHDENQNIYFEMFSDKNALREENESWFDFYRRFRIYGVPYKTKIIDNVTIEVTRVDQPNQPCRLIEHADTLYAFCYSSQYAVNDYILNSLKFF